MDPRETLSTSLAGRYEIIREIGAGGMATVYLAKDLRHDREVALKLLQPELGAVLGVERFLSEIKTTAKLQHPHILPLLDSGDAGGLLFYVMPYVEGESLRARLERERQLPLRDAIRIATEVAGALDYAHRHGVIHRDIKPENILLHDGQALVADFGIALAVQSAGGQRMTQTGLSLGTPQYMSPEQAMGEKTVDARSDIYALGAVTYEMLAGDAPFTGSSVQAIVAKVLNERPTSLRTLRDTVPAPVEVAVMTALSKLAADRFATGKEFADALAASATTSVAGSPGSAVAPRARSRDPVVISLAAGLILAAASTTWLATSRPATSDNSVVRLSIEIPRFVTAGGVTGSGVGISDDGRTIAHVGGGSGAAATQQLVVRKIDSLESRAIQGTDNAQAFALSPDGRHVAFWAAGKLARISLDGGGATVLASTGIPLGMAWVGAHSIVLSLQGKLHIISDSGGAPRPILKGADTVNGALPAVVPGGNAVVAIETGARRLSAGKMVVLSLDDGRRTDLGVEATLVAGITDEFVVYTTASNQLMALPFDPNALRATGPPLGLGVAPPGLGSLQPTVAVSRSGSLVHAGSGGAAELVKIDFRGSPSRVSAEARKFATPRFSPDGRHIAVAIGEANETNVWIFDVGAQSLYQFTEERGGRPEWSANGQRVIYRRGASDSASTIAGSGMWWRTLDLRTPPSPIFTENNRYWEGVMTPDGRGLVLQRDAGGADVIYRSIGDSVEVPLAESSARETQGRPSPDGRWVAYQAAIGGGENQVIVKPLQGGGAQVVVSQGAGTEPVWSRDRQHLYYRDGQQFIEVTYSTSPEFRVVSRRPVFADGYLFSPVPHANYDVFPDGSGILALRPTGNRYLVVVHNWIEELRTREAVRVP